MIGLLNPGTCLRRQELAAALSDAAPAAARCRPLARDLTSNPATAVEPVAAPNLLAEVDRAAQDVVTAIMRAQVGIDMAQRVEIRPPLAVPCRQCAHCCHVRNG
jgi:hypothetical protein